MNDDLGTRDASPDLVPLGDGFIVVWDSYNDPESSKRAVRGRRLDEHGMPVGAQFTLSGQVTGTARLPRVDSHGDGFVVVWQQLYPGTPHIRSRRFASDGSPVGDETQSNGLPGSPDPAAISSRRDGGFVLAWARREYREPARIELRIFDQEARPVGLEFEVSEPADDKRYSPNVATAPDDSMLVVWENRTRIGSTQALSIEARRVSADGFSMGLQFALSSVTIDPRRAPEVAAQPDGSFVVVWSSYEFGPGPDPFGTGVRGRRVSPAGEPIGAPFQLNSYTTGPQQWAVVETDARGDFVVGWTSGLPTFQGVGDPGLSVRARAFSSAGQPVGADFQVNTYTPENHFGARFAVADRGFVASWTMASYASYYSPLGSGVRARRVADPVYPIFADGFESGDALEWEPGDPSAPL